MRVDGDAPQVTVTSPTQIVEFAQGEVVPFVFTCADDVSGVASCESSVGANLPTSVLGEALVDSAGTPHAMSGLLQLTTRIDRPRRILGYRRLLHASALPWPAGLNGHEFHFSAARQTGLPPLFEALDAEGVRQLPMGAAIDRVMGSFAHVIAAA